MADSILHAPCQTSGPPEVVEDNIGHDGMPDLPRSECSSEMAWGIHNTDRNIHNRHSSGELRIEVREQDREPPACPVAYVNISHQGLVAVVERQSLSPKSLPLLQSRSQMAVLQRKSLTTKV